MPATWAFSVACFGGLRQLRHVQLDESPFLCYRKLAGWKGCKRQYLYSRGVMDYGVLRMTIEQGRAHTERNHIISRRALLVASVFLPFALPALDHARAEDKQSNAGRTAVSSEAELRVATSTKAGGTVKYPPHWFKSDKPDGAIIFGDMSSSIVCALMHVTLQSSPSRDPFDVAWNVLAQRGVSGPVSMFVRGASEDAPSKRKGKRSWRFEFDTEITARSGDVLTRKGICRAILLDNPGELVAVVMTTPKETWEEAERNYAYVVDSLEPVK